MHVRRTGEGVYENFVLSAQFCSEPKTALKNSLLSKKQTKQNRKTKVKDTLPYCHRTLSDKFMSPKITEFIYFVFSMENQLSHYKILGPILSVVT